MREYTQQELDDLISCMKTIIEPPRNEMILVNRHLRNDMKLRSIDEKYDFSVFMRKSIEFQTNFSVGLVYRPKDHPEEIHLIRCNSAHRFIYISISEDPHFATHIHRADASNLNSGKREPKKKEITDAYTSYEGAVIYFMSLITVQDIDSCEYLAQLKQTSMFGI